MKKTIDIEDIRQGDLIRWEGSDIPDGFARAVEYRASKNGATWANVGTYYLLERPESLFEPHWGMVIGAPGEPSFRAAYLPGFAMDNYPWLAEGGWESDAWAKGRLAEGWVVIEKPEGVR